jgi:alcohol dehydrogenase (cytochrome c)
LVHQADKVAVIDPKTGEKTINPAAIPHIGQTTVNCPADHEARFTYEPERL